MRRLDLRRINLPIPDRGVIGDRGYDEIVATIDAARSRGGVYVRKAHRRCPENDTQLEVIRRRAGR